MLNKFIVSPMSQNIELRAGDSYNGHITIANPADATEDFYFKIAVHPYSVSGEDYVQDFATYSSSSKIADWIKIETTSGKLAPNETKDINFTIEVPDDVPAGGQYAMIGVSSDPKVSSNQEGAVRSVYEMASLIYANVDGETIHGGEVIQTTLPGFVAVGKPVLTTRVTNTGNVHEILYTTLSVKNVVTGETILPKENSESTLENIIMPDSTRFLSRELDEVPVLGVFELKEEISYLGEKTEISTIMVICPVWFMVLVFATIVSIISMICYGRHLKKKKQKNEDSLEK